MATVPIKTINVTHHAEQCTLHLDPPVINLAPGEAVQWVFHHALPFALPHVFFHPPQATQEVAQFGPFQYLEPTHHKITAFGNTGNAGLYPYTVLLLNQEGPIATSVGTQASVVNLSNEMNTSPDALVTYDPDEPDPRFRLKVQPHTLLVQPGRTVIWYIQNIPDGHFVTFRFTSSPEQEQLTGPFLSFSLSQGFGDDWLANGAGISFNELHPLITYRVTLRNSLGTVVSWDDPTIEPLGPPPNTGTGG